MALIPIYRVDNEYRKLLPVQGNLSPLVLTSEWQDLPSNHIINCQDSTSLGIWLTVSGSAGFELRLQSTYSQDSGDFFTLPIHSTTPSAVNVDYQTYRFTPVGDVKLVLSAALADVLNFVKIQVRGVGTIVSAQVTFKGRV